MPILDLKLYTTISVCVALVAFIYSFNIFTFQKWFLFTRLSTPVDNSPNQATPSSNGFNRIPEKSPGITTSIFQNMLLERYLAPRKPVGLMGPFLTSLVTFLQKEKICVMVCVLYLKL